MTSQGKKDNNLVGIAKKIEKANKKKKKTNTKHEAKKIKSDNLNLCTVFC